MDIAECCSYPPADLFTHCAHETGVGESIPCLTSLLICQERLWRSKVVTTLSGYIFCGK